jgi:hypothetical protein
VPSWAVILTLSTAATGGRHWLLHWHPRRRRWHDSLGPRPRRRLRAIRTGQTSASSSTIAQPWPVGAAGRGAPCVTLTLMPVGELKTFVCPYVTDAGAGCSGACTGRRVIVRVQVADRHIAEGAAGRNDLCRRGGGAVVRPRKSKARRRDRLTHPLRFDHPSLVDSFTHVDRVSL